MDKSAGYIPIVSDFIEFFFPSLCELCDEPLLPMERHLCISCLHALPRTRFKGSFRNLTASRLGGKVPFIFASSYLFLLDNSPSSRLIQQIKYGFAPAVGKYLAQLFAQDFQENTAISSIDIIFPIPLHPQKLRDRGYNQSSYIAQGIADIVQIPVNDHALRRRSAVRSQTDQERLARFENQQNTFYMSERNQALFHDKHILLVDDVLTTGATIRAAASYLIKHCNARISVLTLFIA